MTFVRELPAGCFWFTDIQADFGSRVLAYILVYRRLRRVVPTFCARRIVTAMRLSREWISLLSIHPPPQLDHSDARFPWSQLACSIVSVAACAPVPGPAAIVSPLTHQWKTR